MTGMFKFIQSIFTGTKEDKRKLKFIQNQPTQTKPIQRIRKCRHDGTQRGIAFIKRLLKRRAKRDMAFETNRKFRLMYGG